MLKKQILAFCVCAFSLVINAQNSELARVLEEVAKNNNELKAFASMIESEQLELRASNNLDNPEFGAYYFPFGNHSTGYYTEFQISQSFEFPSVYAARKNLINEQHKKTDMVYVAKRQEVLLSAKKYFLELVVLNKKLAIEQIRVDQSKQVFEQVKTLFDKEQIGILSLNKAKIAWLQEQFSIRNIELQRQHILVELKNLNGGIDVEWTTTPIVDHHIMQEVNSLWQQKCSSDPYLISLQQQELIALQQVQLTKNKSLPNLTAGFNHQGVSGEYYSGIYAGVSIPVFDNRNKVKAAEANYLFQQTYSSFLFTEEKAAFVKQYNDYVLLLEKYSEYNQTLMGLNSDALLLEAYELGEISFIEYYVELQFYREADNAMLDMEKQLHFLKAELLEHQL